MSENIAQTSGSGKEPEMAIEMRDIVKKFGDFTANDHINLKVHVGEVHAILDMAEPALTRAGKKQVAIYGAIPKEARGAVIEQFQTDPDTVLIVGQIDTLSTGVTLTAADTCVYYSKTYNYATYEQGLSRIHRIGQRNTCTYISLVAEKTVDHMIDQALAHKEDLAHTITDTWRQYFE